jgi:hypothetical protein
MMSGNLGGLKNLIASAHGIPSSGGGIARSLGDSEFIAGIIKGDHNTGRSAAGEFNRFQALMGNNPDATKASILNGKIFTPEMEAASRIVNRLQVGIGGFEDHSDAEKRDTTMRKVLDTINAGLPRQTANGGISLFSHIGNKYDSGPNER